MLTNAHVESTCSYWPNNQQLKEHLSIPLTLSIHPFAHQHPSSAIHEQAISQYRCQSCKAFINQLCFIRSQHQYDCSLCGCTNYLQKPIDIRMVQLNTLSYKLKAPSKQRLLTTKQRLAVFILDLTMYGAESKEYLLYSICLIRQFLNNLRQHQISMDILILGFDSAVHQFNVGQGTPPSRSIAHGHLDQSDGQYFPSPQYQIGNSLTSFDNFNIILDELQNQINNKQLKEGRGEALVKALKIGMRLSQGYSGKLFLVSGVRQQIPEFKQRMNKYIYDFTHKHSFITNKKECLQGQLQKSLQTTQVSLSFFFINSTYINAMPFHVMAKQSNGQLRHYFPNQSLLFFHDFRNNIEILLNEQTAYQSLLKIRYSTGVKLVGMFGNYRPTKIPDQIELLTCPITRQYLFQFNIEGRVSSDFIVAQFSSLYTDVKGERYFIIETHCIKVTDSHQLIFDSIDYININISYVRGVIHNLDNSGNLRSLQIAIQERCRKHILALRQMGKEVESQLLRRVKPYIIVTFLMMKHFLLNQNYMNALHFDLNAELRSKVATLEDSINIVWPLVYTVGESGWQLAEMQEHYIPKATTAIFIDRCDQYYCYLAISDLQPHVRTANAKECLQEIIGKDQRMSSVKKLITEIKDKKGIEYIDILPLEDLKQLRILDFQGQYGFDKFINVILEK